MRAFLIFLSAAIFASLCLGLGAASIASLDAKEGEMLSQKYPGSDSTIRDVVFSDTEHDTIERSLQRGGRARLQRGPTGTLRPTRLPVQGTPRTARLPVQGRQRASRFQNNRSSRAPTTSRPSSPTTRRLPPPRPRPKQRGWKKIGKGIVKCIGNLGKCAKRIWRDLSRAFIKMIGQWRSNKGTRPAAPFNQDAAKIVSGENKLSGRVLSADSGASVNLASSALMRDDTTNSIMNALIEDNNDPAAALELQLMLNILGLRLAAQQLINSPRVRNSTICQQKPTCETLINQMVALQTATPTSAQRAGTNQYNVLRSQTQSSHETRLSYAQEEISFSCGYYETVQTPSATNPTIRRPPGSTGANRILQTSGATKPAPAKPAPAKPAPAKPAPMQTANGVMIQVNHTLAVSVVAVITKGALSTTTEVAQTTQGLMNDAGQVNAQLAITCQTLKAGGHVNIQGKTSPSKSKVVGLIAKSGGRRLTVQDPGQRVFGLGGTMCYRSTSRGQALRSNTRLSGMPQLASPRGPSRPSRRTPGRGRSRGSTQGASTSGQTRRGPRVPRQPGVRGGGGSNATTTGTTRSNGGRNTRPSGRGGVPRTRVPRSRGRASSVVGIRGGTGIRGGSRSNTTTTGTGTIRRRGPSRASFLVPSSKRTRNRRPRRRGSVRPSGNTRRVTRQPISIAGTAPSSPRTRATPAASLTPRRSRRPSSASSSLGPTFSANSTGPTRFTSNGSGNTVGAISSPAPTMRRRRAPTTRTTVPTPTSFSQPAALPLPAGSSSSGPTGSQAVIGGNTVSSPAPSIRRIRAPTTRTRAPSPSLSQPINPMPSNGSGGSRPTSSPSNGNGNGNDRNRRRRSRRPTRSQAANNGQGSVGNRGSRGRSSRRPTRSSTAINGGSSGGSANSGGVAPTAPPTSAGLAYVPCASNCPSGGVLLAPRCSFFSVCGNGCYCGQLPATPSMFPTQVPTVNTFTVVSSPSASSPASSPSSSSSSSSATRRPAGTGGRARGGGSPSRTPSPRPSRNSAGSSVNAPPPPSSSSLSSSTSAAPSAVRQNRAPGGVGSSPSLSSSSSSSTNAGAGTASPSTIPVPISLRPSPAPTRQPTPTVASPVATLQPSGGGGGAAAASVQSSGAASGSISTGTVTGVAVGCVVLVVVLAAACFCTSKKADKKTDPRLLGVLQGYGVSGADGGRSSHSFDHHQVYLGGGVRDSVSRGSFGRDSLARGSLARGSFAPRASYSQSPTQHHVSAHGLGHGHGSGRASMQSSPIHGARREHDNL